ncbi:MAG TPA: ATP-binding protein [Thermoanaerobaculaceae bacterium]|nr:ATP-binding protein [Thermoanaerobaculaceae bacterium]
MSSGLPSRRFREAQWLLGAALLTLVGMVVAQMAGMVVMTRLVEEEARRAAHAASQILAARIAGGEAPRYAAALREEGWGLVVLDGDRVVETVGDPGPVEPAWWPWGSRAEWERQGERVAGPVKVGGRNVLVAYQQLNGGRAVRAVVPATGTGAAGWLRTFGASLAIAVAVGGALLAWALIARLLAPYRELLAEAVRVGRGPGEEAEDRFLVETFRTTVRRLEQSEAALRQRADELAVLAEVLTRESAAGVVITDAGGTVRAANGAASVLVGDSLALERPLPAAVASGEASVALGERVVEVRRFPLLAASGAAQGEVVFLTDRTALEALERALAEREQMAAVGELAAGMTHELRNALATIRGYARLLPDAGAPERARFTAAINDEAEGLADLLDRFLRFAQPRQLRRERVALLDLVEEAARKLRTAFPSLALGVEGEPAEVAADPLAIAVAVENLLRNAAEAVAAAGGAVRVRVEALAGWARVVVEDDGPGVSEAVRDRLFLPFASTKPSGGLGLALARRLARLHGGEVEYEPRPTGGSRFVLRLPREGVA